MPEAKLSFPVLREHLRKCWVYYLIGVVAIIFLNNLIFAATRPVVPEDKTVRVMLLNTAQEQESLHAYAASLSEALAAEESSVELLEFENMVTTEDQYFDMLLIVKLTEGYSDLFITNQNGCDSLMEKGAFYPLDGIVAEDDPRALRCANAESGRTQIAALRTEAANKALFPNDELYLLVSPASTNLEDALNVLDMLIDGGLEKP